MFDAWADAANRGEDVLAIGEIQRIVGLQQACGDAQRLGEDVGGLAGAYRGTHQDEIRHQVAFLEAARHVLGFTLALAAQRSFEIAHVGILVGAGVADQREALVCLTHASTSRRPADSRTSKIRKGS
jgi:hypothetical protein